MNATAKRLRYVLHEMQRLQQALPMSNGKAPAIRRQIEQLRDEAERLSNELRNGREQR